MHVTTSTFNNTPVHWVNAPKKSSMELELGNSQIKFVNAATFLGSYRQGTLSAQPPTLNGRDICMRIISWMHCNESESISGSDFGNKVWKGTGQLMANVTFPDDDKTQISEGFIDHVYAPIIPDSIMLKFLYDKEHIPHYFASCHKAILIALTALSYALLLVEIPIRFTATMILDLGLKVYAYKNEDLAAYYQFRLMLNRDRPLQAISSSIINGLY